MSRAAVVAYTDGGCRGNPGAGAWGFLLVHLASGTALERSGAEPLTTNNRMELTSAIQALSSLSRPRVRIEIRSDSRYLIDTATKWMAGWKKRGWRRKGDEEVKNLDLIRALDDLLERHEVTWHWVPGHSGEPGNEYVDELVNAAMDELALGPPVTHEKRHAKAPIDLP